MRLSRKSCEFSARISDIFFMSLPSLPVSKRIGVVGGTVRGSKKSADTSSSDGCLVFTKHTGDGDDSSATICGSTVTTADNTATGASTFAPVDNAPTDAVDISSAVPLPASPSSNRERFMANCQPLQVSCDLATVGMHNASVRFSFTAVILIVYPETKGPDRRHIQLIDQRGSTGITVWNDNVRLFSASSVGQVVRFTKLSITFNNGKKGLSMGRDSSVTFLNNANVPTEEYKWWKSKLFENPLRIIDVHDCEDDVVISTAGIVGMLSTERKRVRDQDRDLLCIRLTDRTGFIDVRSWSHSDHEFSEFLERPLLFQRVRVTSFAGMKTLELLAGAGTVLKNEFHGKEDLQLYWSE
jgi:hypothetical protein